MEELYQRMTTLEAEHRAMNVSIAELQRQRIEDRAIMLETSQDIKTVKEIVIAWNNIKGFVETMKAINATMYFSLKFIAWIVGLGAAILLLIKTGHWPGNSDGQP